MGRVFDSCHPVKNVYIIVFSYNNIKCYSWKERFPYFIATEINELKSKIKVTNYVWISQNSNYVYSIFPYPFRLFLTTIQTVK